MVARVGPPSVTTNTPSEDEWTFLNVDLLHLVSYTREPPNGSPWYGKSATLNKNIAKTRLNPVSTRVFKKRTLPHMPPAQIRHKVNIYQMPSSRGQ